MIYTYFCLTKQSNIIIFIKTFMIFLLSCISIRLDLCFCNLQSTLNALHLNGHFTFQGNEFAATDFGKQYHFLPLAVLHPKSVSDIATTVRHVFEMGPGSELTVAARGHGHSIHGQSQAHQGIVVNMKHLASQETMRVQTGRSPYVEVFAGERWINVLHECLKFGLTPKSWTDYLYLTVGGTLSNAGISGQAFRHGPQISNVLQLEVVTGRGEVVVCSREKNADLFHGVLGGLGQFGIITRARVSLETARKRVKWIRVLYADFATFSRDQENLISAEETFDYIEGFVIVNRPGLLNDWKSSFNPQDPVRAGEFVSDGKTLFCLELTKNFDPESADMIDKEIEERLSRLSYISSTLFTSDVSYLEFLDRVHTSELKLQTKGLWDIPHPWLNLLIPRSKIQAFAKGVFGEILTDMKNGPVLIYPVNKSKWDNRTSCVLPEEDVFYLVAFLSQAVSSSGASGVESILARNRRILGLCDTLRLSVKQYLPHYTKQEEWRSHFGTRWEVFLERKSAYDPFAILAPGQRIFQKAKSIL